MKVRIRDFQSLEDVTLDIQGLTVLTGPNSSGKSAVVRAISGVFQNTPGNAFVRYGQPNTSVSLSFGDSDNVLWEKGPKVNRYVVNGHTLDKVGPRGVPDEVTAFGVLPLEVAGKDVWPQFAPQFDILFLLNSTGTFFAEAISDASTVGALNDSLRECQSDRKKTQAELDVRLNDVVKLEKSLNSFDGFEDVCLILDGVVAMGAKVDAYRQFRLRPVEEYKHERERRLGEVRSFEGLEFLSLPPTPKDVTRDLESLRDLQERAQRARTALTLFPSTTLGLPSEGRVPKLFDALRILIDLRDSRSNLRGQVHLPTSEPYYLPYADSSDLRELAERRRESQTMLARVGSAILSMEEELGNVCLEVQDLKGSGPCPFCGSDHAIN